MYATSFRVSRSMTVGRFLLIISQYWDIQTDFQNYNLFDDNGNMIQNKNMLVFNLLEN